MPVAVSPIDRQLWPVRRKVFFEGRDQRAVLRVDRADAAEQLVVMRHFHHALARHVSPAQNVFEKRQHLAHPLRPAEGDDHDGIIRRV